MSIVDQILRVASDWSTGYPAMELFADIEGIIDYQHRDTLIDEIQERIDQCIEHRRDLAFILADQPILESFLRLAKNTELTLDYGP